MDHVQEVRIRYSLTFLLAILVGLGTLELGLEALGPNAERIPMKLLLVLCAFSPFYFIQVVVLPVFFVHREYSMRVDAGHLLYAITLSMAYSVLVWALLYRKFGMIDPMPGGQIVPTRDSLYLSMVTFSTLGYGDLRVHPDIRLLAGFQGIWGNLHLALWVGAAYFAVGRRRM